MKIPQKEKKRTFELLGFILICGIILILSSFTVQAVNLKDGLVFYYNGSTDFKDSSKSRTAGTNSGTVDSLGIVDRARLYTTDNLYWGDSADFDQVNQITISFWVNVTTSIDGGVIFWDDGWQIRTETDGSHGGCSAGNKLAFVIQGKATVCDNTDTFTTKTWQHWVFIKNSSGVTYYKNGVKGEFDTETNTMNTGTTNLYTGSNSGGTANLDMTLDSIAIYNKSIDSTVVTNLYNGGLDCNPITNPTGCTVVLDTTPPTIGTISRTPTNITLQNLVNTNFNINASITDNVRVKYANLSIKMNNTKVYVNGSLVSLNVTYRNSSVSGNIHRWSLDEHNILSGTYNLNPSLFENTTHNNFTLTGLNNLLKIEFLNVQNNTETNLYEEMSQNLTNVPSTSVWYYCNSSYTTGNPATNSRCVQFATKQNNFPKNHTHGKSFHRILTIPLNTTTGRINGLKVTPTSFFIKKGSTTGEVVYYLNTISRTNAVQLSSTTGTSWSSQTYTPDIHLHQVKTGGPQSSRSSMNYKICALDNSSNAACSVWYSDFIDIPNIPPSEVIIYTPRENGIYNSTLYINNSESVSSSNIKNYVYYYSRGNTSLWTEIINQTDHNYQWDISLLMNGGYKVKVLVTDNNLLTSTTISGDFTINNPLGTTDQLLTDISTTLTNTYNLLDEVLNMLWIVLLYLGLLAFGSWLITQSNVIYGIAIYIVTLGFDFFFAVKLFNDYVLGNMTDDYTGYAISFFGFMLGFWILAKIVIIIASRYKIKKEV